MFNVIIKCLLMIFISCLSVKCQQCPNVTLLQPLYIEGIGCNEEETLEFSVYEDCPTNEEIFEIEEGYIIEEDCPIIKIFDNNRFGFTNVGDAEDLKSDFFICPNMFLNSETNETHSGTFSFIDVNEFLPEPTDGLSFSQSVNVDENIVGIVYNFSYIDKDAGETSSIICSNKFDDTTAVIFDIVSAGVIDNNMMFNIVTKSALDYENTTYYHLETEISSTDPRGNSSSVTQVFLIFVQDVGDNPPFFSKSVAATSIPEGEKNVSVFQVEAKDRDVIINNQIKYTIVQGNDDGYFMIDEMTGEVFTAKEIDRESLESTTFALVIQAQEILEDGSNAQGDSSSIENTNVKIEDINDNIPTFLNISVNVTVEEFNENNQTSTMDLDINLLVVDMDEGDSGKYTLTTNNENVLVKPDSGNGQTSFRVILKNSQDFDYEEQEDDPQIIVQITATETSNSSHVSNLDLTINLLDINDNYPIFDEEEYTVSALETIPSGSLIIDLIATDDDSSSEFNTESIRYSISGCNEFTIDSITGNITLSQSSHLNYEDETSIHCTVTATDMDDMSEDSLRSQVPLTVIVEDVNDEDPYFVDFVDSLTLPEGTETSTAIALIEVEDIDATADLDVIILSSDVDGWFELVPNNDSTPDHYMGNIIVKISPDYEMASEVSLVIQATDDEAEVGDQVKQRTLTIRITDENDEPPQFQQDYSVLNYNENTPEGDVVLIIQASDPDTDDELFFFMDDPEDYLQINETTGEVSVANEVDREEVSSFNVTVTVQDLVNNTIFVEIAVTVNDVNDNTPKLDVSVCVDSYIVPEDADDMQSVTMVTATDDDEGIHGKISYFLQNQNQLGSIYQFAPFQIDQETGEISVHVNASQNFILDREERSLWQLFVEAYDNCDLSDPLCIVNYDSCVMNITIEDVNDNPPGSFAATADIVTNEFLLEGEIISNLEISAFDPDEVNTNNSRINFSVDKMWNFKDERIDPLFEAVNLQRNSDQNTQYYCNLRSTTTLYGKYGVYTIEILGKDFGTPTQKSSSNFTLTIEDSNDMEPIFYYSLCLMNNDYNIIMLENSDINVPLNCTYLDDVQSGADIFIEDFDEPNTPNSDIILRIDMDTSVAIDGNEDNQLDAFYIYAYDPDSSDDNRFAIATNENIDRERGKAYNLSLISQDFGNPQHSTYAWVYITVVDVSEFEPTFCSEAPCQQTLTTKENTNQSMVFLEAQDLDNSGEDVANDPIFYSVIGGDGYAFYIPDNSKNEIRPKIELDRETRGTYEIEIMASNNDTISPPDGIHTTNRVLKVSISILDENDEIPIFAQIIYGEYLDTAYKGIRVALLEFADKDLNDIITYTFGSPFVWNEGQSYTDPFIINRTGDRQSEILLNMKPQGTYGYCSFDIVATDAAEHSSTAKAEIFVVTSAYIVSFYFYNTVDYVQLNKDNIQTIFTDVFNYTCIIDSIDQAKDSNNDAIEGQTVLKSHFIEEILNQSSSSSLVLKPYINTDVKPKDRSKEKMNINSGDKFLNQGLYIVQQIEEQKIKVFTEGTNKQAFQTQTDDSSVIYALVPKEVIEEEASDGKVISSLTDQLSSLGLNLFRIGDYETSDTLSGYEQQITNLKIVIGSVTLFLGLLVIMLIIIYFVVTKRLKREVKVLTTTTFGSRSSALNRLENEVEQVPGSNVYAKETKNPLWNISDDQFKEATKDIDSQGSGDSDLIGAEETLYFSETKNKNKLNKNVDEWKINNIDFEYITTAGEPVPSTSYENANSMRSSDNGLWDKIELHDQTNSDKSSIDESLQAQVNSQFSFA